MNNLAVFAFEGHEVRCVGTAEEPEWIARDVCKVLGLNNVSHALSRLDDDEKDLALVTTTRGKQKLLTINKKGLKRLVSTSYKPNAKKLATILGIEVMVTTREMDCLSIIKAAFAHLSPISQFSVLGYKIDLYFPSEKIAVECDENGHQHLSLVKEQKRETAIINELQCQFIRFNPDLAHFNIGEVINRIMLAIDGHYGNNILTR
ncbi:Bro-N domain-containing protein [Laspinema sp. A4]|uniref:BRO-N domain-containing protein n=1 Tax=Laspinema sp. D2d TaxID=2953686 RepID=UPI0021BB01F9|nr:Bro-N domain-containing protein [Laspinema sp. D2d]MCT7984938.1 Bro-N domain-containing protein [Laspinema sp. D2d]